MQELLLGISKILKEYLFENIYDQPLPTDGMPINSISKLFLYFRSRTAQLLNHFLKRECADNSRLNPDKYLTMRALQSNEK